MDHCVINGRIGVKFFPKWTAFSGSALIHLRGGPKAIIISPSFRRTYLFYWHFPGAHPYGSRLPHKIKGASSTSQFSNPLQETNDVFELHSPNASQNGQSRGKNGTFEIFSPPGSQLEAIPNNKCPLIQPNSPPPFNKKRTSLEVKMLGHIAQEPWRKTSE